MKKFKAIPGKGIIASKQDSIELGSELYRKCGDIAWQMMIHGLGSDLFNDNDMKQAKIVLDDRGEYSGETECGGYLVAKRLKELGLYNNLSLLKALYSAAYSGYDISFVFDGDFDGTAADIKRLTRSHKTSRNNEIMKKIDDKFGRMWDESESAYVVDGENSKQLKNELVALLKDTGIYQYPMSVQYFPSGKYYKVHVDFSERSK